MILTEIYEQGAAKVRELGLYGPVDAEAETDFQLRHNRQIFDHFVFEQTALDVAEATTEVELMGCRLATPVIMSPMTLPLPKIADDALLKVAEGLKAAGSMMWLGFPVPANLAEVVAVGARVGLMVKPTRDRAKIYQTIEMAQKAGVTALGVDIDSGMRTKYLGILRGPDSAPLSTTELADIVRAADVPFVVKGVLSRHDARQSVAAGATILQVSNHGAHALDYLPHPLEVLPDIRETVPAGTTLIADSGFRRGTDVLKALAFGAQAVGLGRPIIYGLAAAGADGVAEVVRQITAELQRVMTMTGCPTVIHARPGIVRRALR